MGLSLNSPVSVRPAAPLTMEQGNDMAEGDFAG
jgi:hypothetical protein